MVGGGAVPETLLRLGVEAVRRPADVVRRVEGDAGEPRARDGGDGAAAREHGVVCGRPANVEVAIDGDERNAEQGIHAADDAEAGRGGAQPRPSVQQVLLSHQCTFEHTVAHL